MWTVEVNVLGHRFSRTLRRRATARRPSLNARIADMRTEQRRRLHSWRWAKLATDHDT